MMLISGLCGEFSGPRTLHWPNCRDWSPDNSKYRNANVKMPYRTLRRLPRRPGGSGLLAKTERRRLPRRLDGWELLAKTERRGVSCEDVLIVIAGGLPARTGQAGAAISQIASAGQRWTRKRRGEGIASAL